MEKMGGQDSRILQEQNVEESESVKVIIGFSEVSFLYEENEKLPLTELLQKFPAELEVFLEEGAKEMVAVSWECSDDYENTEYEIYSFVPTFSEGYVLSEDLTDFDLPYAEVTIAEEESEEEARIAYAANPNSTLTIDAYLGVTGDIVSWLKTHQLDNYYVGTPFKSIRAGSAAACIRPKGEYSSNAGMNCAGFVSSVMKKMGGNLSKIVARGSGSYANASNWTTTVSQKNIKSYRYTSISAMLASGKLEKGDLIYFEPNWGISGSDCHIGFFWGDFSSDNKFWHSATGQGNAITKIKSVSNYRYVYIFKTQKRGTLKLNVSTSTGESANLKGTVYKLYNSSGKLAATMTVNANNTISKANLPVGTYTLKQTTTLSGYQKDTKTYTVKITNGKTTTQKLQVTKNVGPVKLTVTSANTSLTNGKTEYSLQGAIYKLYVNGTTIKYLTTNANGYAEVSGVPFGTYTLKQIKASAGYKLDTQSYSITVSSTSGVSKSLTQPPMDQICTHTWNANGTVVLEPSSVLEGEVSYTCTSCGQVKSELTSKVTSLAKPVLVSVTNQNGTIAVKWNRVTYAKGYYVYRKVSGGSWSRIATITNGATISYNDSKATAGKTNIYTVRAYEGSVISGYDASGKSAFPIKTPTLVSAKCSDEKVTITWKKVDGAAGYRVYRKESGGKWVGIAKVKSGSKVTYVDTKASVGKTYTYTVRAYNGNVLSSYNSKGVSAKVTKQTYAKYKTTTKLNYRTGAGTSYKKARTLAKNKTVYVVKGYTKKVNGLTWYKIKIKSKYYYVSSKYLKKVK